MKNLYKINEDHAIQYREEGESVRVELLERYGTIKQYKKIKSELWNKGSFKEYLEDLKS